MKAVLLGGNGFIGTRLAETLVADGYDCVSCDQRPPRRALSGVQWAEMDIFSGGGDVLRELLAGAPVVYHLAWRYLPAASNRHMEAEAEANVPGTLRLLRLCAEVGVRRVVFFSSGGSVYGPAQHLPIAETHPTEPLTAHAVSKLAVEKYLDIFARVDGLDYVILRPGNPFGPYQDPDGGQGAIAAFMARTAAGQPLEVWGDGSVVRDYFFVSDLARAAQLAATTPRSRAVYNIGSGVGRSLNDVIAAIEVTTGRTLEVHRLPARPSDAPVNILDITRVQQALGWSPQVSFDDGLRRTWEYYTRTDGS